MLRLWAALALLVVASGCDDVRSMRRSRNVSGLSSALTHSDSQVRIKAADALGHVGDPRAIQPLIKALEDESAYVREHAARNLGCNHHSTLGCDTAEARAPLEKVLDDTDPFVRLEAARSLGELRDPAAREPLVTLLRREKRLDVKREVILALGRLGDREAQPVLEELRGAEEPRIRAAAEEALERLATSRRRGPRGRDDDEPDDDEGGASDVAEADAAGPRGGDAGAEGEPSEGTQSDR